MATFTENKIITVYCWNLETGIFTESKKYQAEKGLGLPSGMTLDQPPAISGSVSVMDADLNQWVSMTDDRGRIFYDKFNGEKVQTTIVGEVVDRRSFTAIAPPKIDEDQLLAFDDSQQEWVIGFDWYELPIWNEKQEKSFFTGEFFIPDEYFTNIEPTPEQEGFILNELGGWVAPPIEDEQEE
jgi:hypothetical protein